MKKLERVRILRDVIPALNDVIEIVNRIQKDLYQKATKEGKEKEKKGEKEETK